MVVIKRLENMTEGVRVRREFRVFSLQEAERRYSSLRTCER